MTETFHYDQEPDAPFAGAGQPLFFKRQWGGNPQEPFERDGIVYVSMAPAEPVTIYGYSIRLTGEDADAARYAWSMRESFCSWCYSVMEPRGEPGFVPLAEVQEITREEFEAAAAERWMT
jgi:hypothetical protein